MEKIIYKIHILTAGVSFKLKVNDVVLAKESKGLGFSSQFSINEWVFNGGNLIQVELNDDEVKFNYESYIKFYVGVAPVDSPDFKEVYKKELLDLETNPKYSINYTLMVEDLPVSKSLTDLPNIPFNNKDLIGALYTANRELYDLFKSKDEKEILAKCKFRMDEFDKVNYALPNSENNNFSGLLAQTFTSEVMLKYIVEELSLDFSAGGKLVSLRYEEYDLPAINSSPPDYSITRSFKFYWALNEENKFYIYR